MRQRAIRTGTLTGLITLSSVPFSAFSAPLLRATQAAQHRLMERRSDQVSAMLIDAAVNLTKRDGALPPISELTRLGISLEVAVRVLTQPSNRRHRRQTVRG